MFAIWGSTFAAGWRKKGKHESFPKGHSAKMLKFSQFVRSRLALQQTAPAEHLDAGVLAAFAEQRLSADERSNVLAHLAHCPECREVLALTSDAVTEPRSQESGFSHRFPVWAWSATAAAALACLVVALIWPTSLLRHAPPPPALVARATAPPPPILSAPEIAKRNTPEPTEPRKRFVAKASAPPPKSFRSLPHPQNDAIEPNRMLLEAEQSPAPQQADIILPPDLPKPPAIRTTPVPGAHAMFQAKSFIAPEKLMIAARQTQQPASLWRLSGDPGTLQKSTDGGMTWQTVRLNEDTPLYALSVTGPDVWVGGAGATLLHSADGGVHWNKVPIANENFEITQIESRDRYTLRLTTRSGEHWITTDGGLHWRRE